ncbi:MAG: hypothetical protein KDE47_22430 [Caldilineaceae bacterium]|nr:hypothetical protein [Caldilineaceae bacterium]
MFKPQMSANDHRTQNDGRVRPLARWIYLRQVTAAILFALIAGLALMAQTTSAAPPAQGSTVPTATPTSAIRATATATRAIDNSPAEQATATPTAARLDNSDGIPGSSANVNDERDSSSAGTATPTLPARLESTCESTGDTTLELILKMGATAVRVGQPVTLEYVITNTGVHSACNVQLHNELPALLELVSLDAGTTQTAQEQPATEAKATVVTATWAEVPASGQVTAVMTLKVSDKARPGQIVDDLAAVGADNAPRVGVGVSLALPPTTPPDFRY